jgi:hypothetical protein
MDGWISGPPNLNKKSAAEAAAYTSVTSNVLFSTPPPVTLTSGPSLELKSPTQTNKNQLCHVPFFKDVAILNDIRFKHNFFERACWFEINRHNSCSGFILIDVQGN